MFQSIARSPLPLATATASASEIPSVLAPGPQLTIVVPTRNEHDNVRPVYHALCQVLQGIDWEVIFVDDDSNDATPESVCRLANSDRRVRCIQRIGRRGLASACVEGILASCAPYIAVMDADLPADFSWYDGCYIPFYDQHGSGRPKLQIHQLIAGVF